MSTAYTPLYNDNHQHDNNDTFEVPSPDVKANLYPYALVWSPLPVITQLIPFIGHLGIADSNGKIHDFHGSYYVSVNNFMTGRVFKYLPIPARESGLTLDTSVGPKQFAEKWDQAVVKSDRTYGNMTHNLCSNNCHHHSAEALQNMGLKVSMLRAWWLILTRGKWVSRSHQLQTYLPSVFLYGIIILIIVLVKVFA